MRELDDDTSLEDACSASQMLPGSLASAKAQFNKNFPFDWLSPLPQTTY